MCIIHMLLLSIYYVLCENASYMNKWDLRDTLKSIFTTFMGKSSWALPILMF